MKGASDGGVFIPHSDKRFPGYDTESKKLDADVLKKYIYGGHVAEYMESLEEEDEERFESRFLAASRVFLISSRFKRQFSTYLEDGIGSDDIEEIYTSAHAAIRENPTFKPTEKTTDWKAESLKHKVHRLTLEGRREKIAAKIEKFKATGGTAEEEEEEEEE